MFIENGVPLVLFCFSAARSEMGYHQHHPTAPLKNKKVDLPWHPITMPLLAELGQGTGAPLL